MGISLSQKKGGGLPEAEAAVADEAGDDGGVGEQRARRVGAGHQPAAYYLCAQRAPRNDAWPH